jgi:general secretion pathway protein A
MSTTTTIPTPLGDADVRSHFELRATPFTREIGIKQRWQHPQSEEVLHALLHHVEQRMSCALIAPAGTGKTVILRALCSRLPEARYRVHYVKVTGLSKRDFCREVSRAIGLQPTGHYGALVKAIQTRCRALYEQESLRPVIILDEAHDMRPEVLAILRVLTNFDMDSKLVVSLILAGQPALRASLRRAELDAIRGRIARYETLRLLTRAETREYIEHRCTVAGSRTEPFADDALDAVYEATQGNMRAIDRLAFAAMLEAVRSGEHTVDANHVIDARKKVAP